MFSALYDCIVAVINVIRLLSHLFAKSLCKYSKLAVKGIVARPQSQQTWQFYSMEASYTEALSSTWLRRAVRWSPPLSLNSRVDSYVGGGGEIGEGSTWDAHCTHTAGYLTIPLYMHIDVYIDVRRLTVSTSC